MKNPLKDVSDIQWENLDVVRKMNERIISAPHKELYDTILNFYYQGKCSFYKETILLDPIDYKNNLGSVPQRIHHEYSFGKISLEQAVEEMCKWAAPTLYK